VPPPAHAPASRANWWNGLVSAARGASQGGGPELAPLDDRAVRERIALASAALGLLMILLALVVGLREAPVSLLSAPLVVASVVVARAAVAVGMLVVGLTFVRAAERVYFR
jgi:hypothetical protein